MKPHGMVCWWVIASAPSVALVSTSIPYRPHNFLSFRRHGQPSSAAPLTEVLTYNKSKATSVERISKESPAIRALEIAGIVLSRIVIPLSLSILKDGLVDDWNEFWSRPNGGKSNAEGFTDALELLGPVYVKVGQALASRPDQIPRALAEAMSTLQDSMQPFDSDLAKSIIVEELLQSQTLSIQDMEGLLESLTGEPVAAASVGQVYKARLGSQPVAIKVQRPGIRTVVERDAALLRSVATLIESIPALPFMEHGPKSKNRLVATDLVDAVDEFMSRVNEELDYRNEAANAATFASLYSHRGGSSTRVKVVVPEIYPDLCSKNVIVMEWLDGTKLTSFGQVASATVAENLALIASGIECTLSQLLDTGVMHADPHGGNLLKIEGPDGPLLGYLDFGLLSSVPQSVRDALVCSVAHLIFDRDMEAVATLFGELQLVPNYVVEDREERRALTTALETTMNEALVYDDPANRPPGTTNVPKLSFDKLLDNLALLVPRFRFRLPPYFLNNARALSTLEGIALSLDDQFNVLDVLYPYALERMMANPTKSQVVDDTLQCLIRSSHTGCVEIIRIRQLLSDASLLTGYGKGKLVRDVLTKSGGRRLARALLREKMSEHFTGTQAGRKRRTRLLRL